MTRRLVVPMMSVVWLALVLGGACSLAAAGRMDSQMTCESTHEPLVYRCTVRLTDRQTGRPVEHARFMMHTSMPSMPMAHHMPPVEGVPGDEPGVYHGTLRFEMAGQWAIDIRTSAPSRDLMRHRITVRRPGQGPPREKHDLLEPREKRR